MFCSYHFCESRSVNQFCNATARIYKWRHGRGETDGARGNARLGLIVRGKSPFSEVGVLEFWIDIHASDKRDMTEATQTNPLQQRIPVFHGMWRGSNKAGARGAPRTCS